MLTFAKIIFIVLAGIFLVSFLEEGVGEGFSLLDPAYEGGSGGSTDQSAYTRSYDTNNDGVVSDREYRDGELERIAEEIERLEEAVAEAQRTESRSPHYGAVRLSVSGAYADERNEEYVTLTTGYDNTAPVNITGWRLKSLVSGRSATIPKGVRTLSSGRAWLSDVDDILLAPDDRAYVVTGGAAGIRTSFLTNKCIGYLAETRDMTPSLPWSCPRLEDEDLARFDLAFDDFRREREFDACMDAIEEVPMCERVISPDSDLIDECRDFIREYSTYNGCLRLHRDDPDFFGDEWYVFLNVSRSELWREEREAIALFDTNGLLVDIEEY